MSAQLVHPTVRSGSKSHHGFSAVHSQLSTDTGARDSLTQPRLRFLLSSTHPCLLLLPYLYQPHSATPAHPEYPSTHQVSVGAILEVLLRTLGRDDVAFSIGSEGTPWLTRSYKSLTSAAKEVGGETARVLLTAMMRCFLRSPYSCWTVD